MTIIARLTDIQGNRIGARKHWLTRRRAVLGAFCLLFSLHAGFRGSDADRDAHAYIDFFQHQSSMSAIQFMDGIEGVTPYYSDGNGHTFELGFAALSFLLSR